MKFNSINMFEFKIICVYLTILQELPNIFRGPGPALVQPWPDPSLPSGPWPLRAGRGPANTSPALALEVQARAKVLRPCQWTV